MARHVKVSPIKRLEHEVFIGFGKIEKVFHSKEEKAKLKALKRSQYKKR